MSNNIRFKFLYFAVAFILGSLLGRTIVQSVNWLIYDKNYEDTFSSRKIFLGETGNPINYELDENMPNGFVSLEEFPRVFEIVGCTNFSIDENSVGVNAFTDFYKPEEIEITVPRSTDAEITICGPEGKSVRVVLWQIVKK